MSDEENTKNFNTNETLIFNLTKKVCELEDKIEKINSVIWKSNHKFSDFEKIKKIIQGQKNA